MASQQKSPVQETPTVNKKERLSKANETLDTKEDQKLATRRSAPMTPKNTQSLKNVKKSNIKIKEKDQETKKSAEKSSRPKSVKKRVNQTDVQESKKKVFTINNEVINVMVPKYTTKSKFNDQAVIQAAQGGRPEMWANQTKESKDISFADSDVADEFEYKYDPNYLSPTRINQSSPKVRMNLSHQKKKESTPSITPNLLKKKQKLMNNITPEKLFKSAVDEGVGESNEFIKKACKEISNTRPQRKQSGKKNFVKRMVFDITKRQARDKTFDNIKDVLHLKVARLDSSRSMSPSARIGSPDGETIHRQSQASNLISPRKFTPKDRDRFINRMMVYEERKQKAIEMMQGARRQDEDAEYLQAVKNKKLTERQKKDCYDRLAGDAEKRKRNQIQMKHQMQIQQEEEAKILFRPKIITNYQKDRTLKKSMKGERTPNQQHMDTEASNNNLTELQSLTLEQKIALFQQDAQKKSYNRVASNKSSAIGTHLENNHAHEEQDEDSDSLNEDGVQILTQSVKSLKQQ